MLWSSSTTPLLAFAPSCAAIGRACAKSSSAPPPLERFDASKATCFKLSDKHKLLGVIETGAGSLHHFNMQVRTLFRDGKRGSIMRMPSMERRKSSSTLDPPRDLDAAPGVRFS